MSSVRRLKKAARAAERRSGKESFMAKSFRERAAYYRKRSRKNAPKNRLDKCQKNPAKPLKPLKRLNKSTGCRKPVKRNSGTKRRRNPEGEAAETYRNFHGKDPDVVIDVATPVRYHGKLSGIGKLEFIKVVPVAGRGLVEIQFKGTMLAQNEKRTQLFITGGDQSVNIRDFGITRVHESEVLGECKEVGYFTEKLHLVAKDGGRALYVHKFGPNRPFIIYDTRNKLLSFAGGNYTIPSEGIDG